MSTSSTGEATGDDGTHSDSVTEGSGSATQDSGDGDSGDGDSGDGDSGDGDSGDGDSGDGDGDSGDGDGDSGDGDGDSGDGDGDSGDGDSGDGDSGDGDGGDGDGDGEGGDGDGDGEQFADWLLSIRRNTDNTRSLIQINVAAGSVGETTVICPSLNLPATLTWPTSVNSTGMPSLTFNDDVLYGTFSGTTLIQIDPCECEITEIGNLGNTGFNGISSNEAQEMWGISAGANAMFDIDPLTAMTTEISLLGFNIGSNGLTWSTPDIGLLYAINATTDQLHSFDAMTGAEVGTSVALNHDFVGVGIELHPGQDVIYACAGLGSDLYEVNPNTGNVSSVGIMDTTFCTALAAPFGPVDCVPPPE